MINADTIQDVDQQQLDVGGGQQPPAPQGPGDGDKIKALYDAVSKDYELKDLDSFRQAMQDPDRRKAFYNSVGKDYDLGTFDQFDKAMSNSTAAVPKIYLQDIQQSNKTATQDPTVLTPMGELKQSELDPTFAAQKQASQANLTKSIAGYSTQIGQDQATVSKVLSDFPNETNDANFQQYAKLSKDNPIAYDRLKAADENKNLIAKTDVHAANEYNELQDATDVNDLTQNINRQRQIIYSTLSGNDRQKALDNLQINKESFFNALDPNIQSEQSSNKDLQGLDAYQYAGLKSLQAFNPGLADQYQNMLKPRGNQSEDTAEQKIGLEKVKQNLLTIGRSDTAKYLNEQGYNLSNQYDNAQTDDQKTVLQSQFLSNKNTLDSINADSQKDTARFPYLADLKLDEQARELSGVPAMGAVQYALSKFGRGVGSSIKAIQNVETSVLGTDQDVAGLQLQRMGESAEDESKFYLPEAYKPTGSPMVYKFSSGLKSAANSIKNNSSLTDEQKQNQLKELVKNNQDKVDFVTNPEAGKSANVFSKATLYRNAGMIGDIASFAAQQAGLGAAGASKMVSAATPMFLGTQNDFYKEALEKGEANPSSYANTHAAIMMLAGLINPDINIVKRTIGAGPAKEMLNEVSEDTWNNIVNANKPILNKLKNSTVGILKEGAGLVGVYGAGTSIASDLANKGLFNENISTGDVVNNAVKSSRDVALSSISLLGLKGITGFKDVSPEQKALVWELGHNPKLNIEKIDNAVSNGEISSSVGDQRKAIINNVAKLIDKVPSQDANGKPISDKSRADYLYNLIIKDKIGDIQKDLPEGQQEKLSDIKDQTNDGMNNILQGKKSAETDVITPEFPSGTVTMPDAQFLEARHADTRNDPRDVVDSDNNEPITAKGRKDADDLVGQVKDAEDKNGVKVNKVISSTTERGVETGDDVAGKLGVTNREQNSNLNAWDIKDFDGMKDKDWDPIQKWFVDHPDEKTYDGKSVGESFNEYKDRVIKARTALQGEPASTLLINHSHNMKMWEAYKDNGFQWNEAAKQQYLNTPSPEPATLATPETRAKEKQEGINKINQNATDIRSDQGQGSPTGNATGGSQDKGSQNLQRNAQQETKPSGTEQQTGQPVKEGAPEGEENDISGIKNDISKPIRQQRKLPEVDTPKLGSDKDVLADGKRLVDSGEINPRVVVDRINSDPKSTFTPDEAKAMQYYMRQLATHDVNLRSELASATDINHQIDVRSQLGQLDDEIEAATRANIKGGSDWGQIGNIRQIVVDQGFNPSREKYAITDAYGGKIPDAVQNRIDAAMKERNDALEQRNKLEEQLRQKEAELNAEKMKKISDRSQRDAKRYQTKQQLKEEEVKLLGELKKAIKRDLGNAYAGIPIPVGTVEAIGKLAINYFKQGINDLSGIVDKIHDNIKDEIDGVTKKDVRDLLARYKPLEVEAREKETNKLETKATNLESKISVPDIKREKIFFEKDTRWMQANQRVINAEYKIKQEKQMAYNSRQNWFQKTLGWANHIFRLSILSGKAVLAKLSAQATIGSLLFKTPESIMNHIWSTAIPEIGKRADIEGYFNAKAEGKFYSEFFNAKKFAKSAWEIAKTGASQLTKERENQIYTHIKGLDLPTDLHTIIKEPPKRAVYEWALEHLLTDLTKKGVDINDPLVLESAKDRAFSRAKYEIFLEDNAVSKKFGEWETKWRGQGNVGALKSFALHFIFPVSKVPTNIARRIGVSVTGLPRGLYAAREAFSKGIDNLNPDEANEINRMLTKGTIGWMLYGTGFLGAYAAFGGLYNKEISKAEEARSGLKKNQMNLGGVEVPTAVQHAVPMQIMQLGATTRRIYDLYRDKDQGVPLSTFKSIVGSAASIVSEIPVVETPYHLAGALFNEPGERKKVTEDMQRRIEPQILRETGIIPPAEKSTRAGTGGGSGGTWHP